MLRFGSVESTYGGLQQRSLGAVVAATLILATPMPAQQMSLITGSPTSGISGVWGTSPNNLYVAGGYQGLAVLHGNTWTSQNVSSWANRYRVSGNGNGIVYSAGQNGYQTGSLIRSVNGGAWSAVFTPTTELTGLWVAADGSVLASGDGRFFYSSDGVTFLEAPTGLSTAFNVDRLESIWGRSATDAYISGRGGLYHWDGSTFSRVNIPAVDMLGSHYSGSSWWAVGANGQVWKGGGSSWTQMNVGTTDNLLGVWAFNDADVWVSGDHGRLRHFDGTTWTTYDASVTGVSSALGQLYAVNNRTLIAAVLNPPATLVRVDLRGTVAPEPSTELLITPVLGLLGIALRRRRARRRN